MLSGDCSDNTTVALIDELREEIAADRFELSKHAVDRITTRRIRVQEFREAVARAL